MLFTKPLMMSSCCTRNMLGFFESLKTNNFFMETIVCYLATPIDKGTILETHNTTEVNHFGPDVYYKGTKLSAVVRVPPQPENDDFGWTNKYVPLYKVFYPDTTPQEDASKVEEILPEDDSTPNPKSEVEDLNNQ